MLSVLKSPKFVFWDRVLTNAKAHDCVPKVLSAVKLGPCTGLQRGYLYMKTSVQAKAGTQDFLIYLPNIATTRHNDRGTPPPNSFLTFPRFLRVCHSSLLKTV